MENNYFFYSLRWQKTYIGSEKLAGIRTITFFCEKPISQCTRNLFVSTKVNNAKQQLISEKGQYMTTMFQAFHLTICLLWQGDKKSRSIVIDNLGPWVNDHLKVTLSCKKQNIKDLTKYQN